MHNIESVQISIDPDGADSSSYTFGWDKTNEKIIAYYAAIAGTINTPAFTGTAPAGTTGTVTYTETAATLGHPVYVVPAGAVQAPITNIQAESSATGLMKDQDVGPGVDVYVVVDDANFTPTYQLGHLEFVSPTNANSLPLVASGAESVPVFDDDDAASNGVVCRIVAGSGGWEATTAASKDILVRTSSGKFIHINHATTGSTPNVQLDEDAAGGSHEYLITEAVDNANEPYSLFVLSIAATEDVPPVAPFANLGQLGQLVTSGPKSFEYLVGAAGNAIQVASRPDAATIPGAVALYVQAAAAGFNAANFGGKDLFIPDAGGEYTKVAYAASPAGVQVYSYPEGATGDLTLQANVADDADETFVTEAAVGAVRDTPAGTIGALTLTGTDAALTEVAAGVNLAAVYIFVSATGW
jgi:hypothetical protein